MLVYLAYFARCNCSGLFFVTKSISLLNQASQLNFFAYFWLFLAGATGKINASC